MPIKKRITLSNILMLAIPVAIIYLIVRFLPGIIVNLYGDWTPGNSAFPVQGQIHDTLKQNGGLPDETIRSLEERGYQLLIVQQGEELYSSLQSQSQEIAQQYLEQRVSSMISISHNTAVVRESIPLGQKNSLTVLAINTEYRSNPLMEDQIRKAMGWIPPVTLLVSLVAIAITNKVLTGNITKSILKPLELLQMGTRRIRDGNLDFQLSYDGKDEFVPVFADFEDMRCRLQNSVNSQLKSEESRKELLAGISHDLRTPLTVIKGYAEGLCDGVAVTPEKQEKYLITIYNKACELDQMVDQLFLFSKMDAGRYPFTFLEVDFGGFLDSFFEMARDEFICQGLTVTMEREDASMPVLLDSTEFSRVLVNILTNSVKYARSVNPHCHIQLKREGNGTVLSLADNGAGVAEENLDKLFESFYREDAARSAPDKGSGLGLSIAKRIIEAHGGTIRALNNHGLTLEICIPLQEEGKNEAYFNR